MKKNNNIEKNIKAEETQGSACPVYKKCSGCGLRNMNYDEQLRFKYIMVDRLMGKICRPERIIGMDDPEGYRCKVQSAFDFRYGKAVSGVYQSATGGVIEIDRCLSDAPIADEITKAVRKLAVKMRIPIWSGYNKTGFLRSLLIRIAPATNEILCVIVGSDNNFPSKKAFTEKLREECPQITTLCFSVNRSDKLTLGNKIEILYGKGYIEDILCDTRFIISPLSFAQINPKQAEVLYNTAIKYAGLNGTETVIDAYCGIGTLSLIAAKKSGQVYACEINRSAVNDAVKNAKLNGIDNVRFVCADSGDFLTEFAEEGMSADVVIADPARAGCDKKFLSALVKIAPQKIVYVSCNPETQARDIFYLLKNGYKVKKIQPVDMFPFTKHVETVALLSKVQI